MHQLKLFLFLIINSLFLSACDFQQQIDGLQNQINDLNSGRIASIDLQIENIESSIKDMDRLDKERKTLIQQFSEKVAELEHSDESQAAEIITVKASLEQLEQTLGNRIDELKFYVVEELLKERDWTTATFSTLEQYQKTCDELAVVKQGLADMKDILPQSVSAAVSESENSMKSWVNDQLTAYCTIADVDAKLKRLESSVECGDVALEEKFQALKSELETTKDNIRVAYEKAIKDAIADSDGVLTAKISAEIRKATETMQTRIDALWEKILETRYPLEALRMALSTIDIDISSRLIHHSDRGCQYCSNEYVSELNKYGVSISMTQSGDPLENAIAERANGILKVEWLYKMAIATRDECQSVLERIIRFYNTERPHMSVGMQTPESVHQQEGFQRRCWKNSYAMG